MSDLKTEEQCRGDTIADTTNLEVNLCRVTLEEAVQASSVTGKEEEGNGGKGKGKGKKSRRAKKDKPEETDYCCNVCLTVFATRNKLFQHIKDEDHMQATPSPASPRKVTTRRR